MICFNHKSFTFFNFHCIAQTNTLHHHSYFMVTIGTLAQHIQS